MRFLYDKQKCQLQRRESERPYVVRGLSHVTEIYTEVLLPVWQLIFMTNEVCDNERKNLR